MPADLIEREITTPNGPRSARNTLLDRFVARGVDRQDRAAVAGRQGGHPLGDPPGDLAAYAGGFHGSQAHAQIMADLQGSAVRTPLFPRQAPRQFKPDVFESTDAYAPPESSDTLWFSWRGLPAWAWRFQVPRKTPMGTGGMASLKARGSSSQRSGPEGTLVIYPPRLPRWGASRRAISPNTINRPSTQRVETPQIDVVTASNAQGKFP